MVGDGRCTRGRRRRRWFQCLGAGAPKDARVQTGCCGQRARLAIVAATPRNGRERTAQRVGGRVVARAGEQVAAGWPARATLCDPFIVGGAKKVAAV